MPHLEGDPPRLRWWPLIRVRASLRSLYQRLRDTRRIMESAERRRRQMAADAERMVAHAETPAPQPVHEAIEGLGFDSTPRQRCRRA